MTIRQRSISAALAVLMFVQGCSSKSPNVISSMTKESAPIQCDTRTNYQSESELMTDRHGYYLDERGKFICDIGNESAAYLKASGLRQDGRYSMAYIKSDVIETGTDYSHAKEIGSNIIIAAVVVGALYLAGHAIKHELDDGAGFSGGGDNYSNSPSYYGPRYQWDTFPRYGKMVTVCRDMYNGRFANDYLCP